MTATTLHGAATRWLSTHWQDARCLVCKSDNWSIQPNLLEMRSAFPEAYPRLTARYLVVECMTCGHASFFNASLAGLDALASEEAAVAASR